jgi:hypothetical protein
MKFQALIKDEYIIHKKTIKIDKKKKYKNFKGTGSENVPDFILPKEFDINVFKKVKNSLLEKKKEEEKKSKPEVSILSSIG